MPHRAPSSKSIGVMLREKKCKRYKEVSQHPTYKICPKCGRHGKVFIDKTADEDYYCRFCLTIFTGKGEIIDG